MLISSLHCLRMPLWRTVTLGTTYKRKEVMTSREEYCPFFIPSNLSGTKMRQELENNVEEYLSPYLHCKYCFLATI